MNIDIISEIKLILKEGMSKIDYEKEYKKEYKKELKKFFKIEKEIEVLERQNNPKAEVLRNSLDAIEERLSFFSAQIENG